MKKPEDRHRPPMTKGENMRRIKSKNTRPEMLVRRILRSLGYIGYRLHRKDILGCPDIAFIGRKKVIFVHGCFWHGHDCKVGIRKPKSNQDYWLPKIERNRNRFVNYVEALQAEGWNILTIWECQLKNVADLSVKLEKFMNGNAGSSEYQQD